MCLPSRVLDLTGPGFTPSVGLRLQTPVFLHSTRQNTASKRVLRLAAMLHHSILKKMTIESLLLQATYYVMTG